MYAARFSLRPQPVRPCLLNTIVLFAKKKKEKRCRRSLHRRSSCPYYPRPPATLYNSFTHLYVWRLGYTKVDNLTICNNNNKLLDKLGRTFTICNMSLAFWKPGSAGPGSTLDRASQGEENVIATPANSSLSIDAQRQRLPIYKHSMCEVSDGFNFVSHLPQSTNYYFP